MSESKDNPSPQNLTVRASKKMVHCQSGNPTCLQEFCCVGPMSVTTNLLRLEPDESATDANIPAVPVERRQ